MADDNELLMKNIQPYLMANALNLAILCGRLDITKHSDFDSAMPVVGGVGTKYDGSVFNILPFVPQPVFVKKIGLPATRTPPDDNVSELFNAMGNESSMDFVTDIPDDIRSELKPKVKVYKHFVYGSKNQFSVDLELASSYFNKQKQKIDDGAVLTDVEFVYLGQTPAEIESNINVTLRLFATNVGKYFDFQHPDPIYAAIGNTGASGVERAKLEADNNKLIKKFTNTGVRWLDLLKINLGADVKADTPGIVEYINDAGFETPDQVKGVSLRATTTQETAQRIRLEIGYADISDETFSDLGYSPDKVAKIRKDVASQTKVYMLSLKQHNISFNPDGSAEIQIDYVASSGTSVYDRVSDLLYDPFIQELTNTYRDDITKLRAELTSTKSVVCSLDPISYFAKLGDAAGQGSAQNAQSGDYADEWDTSKYKEVFTTRNEKREAIKKRQDYIKKLRIGQAKLLLNGLYGPILHLDDSEWQYDFQKNLPTTTKAQALHSSRVWTHAVDAEELIQISSEVGRTRMRDADTGTFFRSVSLRPYSQDIFNKLNRYNLEERLDYSRASNLSGLDENLPKVFGTGLGESHATRHKTLHPGAREIHFVFFGDIVEVAFEILCSNNRFGTAESFEDKFYKMSPMISLGKKVKNLDDWAAYGNVASFFRLAVDNPAYDDDNYNATTAHYSYDAAQMHKALKRMYETFGEFLMSDIIYKSPANPNDTIRVSLADLPINFYEYKRWIIETVVESGRSTLNFKQFIDSLITNFVRPLIVQGASSHNEPPEILFNLVDVIPNNVLVEAPSPGRYIPGINYVRNTVRGQYPHTLPNGNQKQPGFLHALIESRNQAHSRYSQQPRVTRNNRYRRFNVIEKLKYFPSTNAISFQDLKHTFKRPPNTLTDPRSLFTGRKLTIISQSPQIEKKYISNGTPLTPTQRQNKDRKNNVPHITFSTPSSGLLKNITFEREDMPYRREAILFEGSHWRDNEIIAEKYNVTLDLVGTTFFLPGTQFYLNPDPLNMGYAGKYGMPGGKEVSAARALGLGGYFTAIRVTHNINLGGSTTWETTIDSKWDSFGDTDGTPFRPSFSGIPGGKIASVRERLKRAKDPNNARDMVRVYNAQLTHPTDTPLDPDDY